MNTKSAQSMSSRRTAQQHGHDHGYEWNYGCQVECIARAAAKVVSLPMSPNAVDMTTQQVPNKRLTFRRRTNALPGTVLSRPPQGLASAKHGPRLASAAVAV